MKNLECNLETGIQTDEKEQRILTPKLIWPCFFKNSEYIGEKDQDSFIGITMVSLNSIFFGEAKKRGYAVGSSEFWECFDKSQNVLFADLFFDEFCYERLFRQLNKIAANKDMNNKDIRIYCKQANVVKLQSLHGEKQKKNKDVFKKFKITINSFAYEFSMHDRFAIMDQEIWHCGAAVGGMSGKLSALSRGWEDKNNILRDFFDNR